MVVEISFTENALRWKKLLSEKDWEEIITFLNCILKNLFQKEVYLSILFTDDTFIQYLNRQWRKKDKPTDVLSFPQDFPPRTFSENLSPEEELKEATEKCLSCNVLGDIVISLERAFYQSKEYEITLKEEIKRLLVHGLVHLLGFDHEINEDSEKKFQSVERIVYTFGICQANQK